MPLTIFSDESFMKEALKEAQKASDLDEVPVGAVIICDNRIIARSYNMTERLNDVTAHAEMLAITAAAHYLGSKYLTDCTLYVTLEPCIMCAGAIYWAQMAKLVYGASDEKKGFTLTSSNILHPATSVQSGIFEKESSALLKAFFRKKR